MSLFKMPDYEFDLMTVSDAELFYALKGELVNTIKKLTGLEDIESEQIAFDEQFATRRKAYGKDYNLYPLIVLPFRVKDYLEWQEFDVILNPFEVAVLRHKMDAEIIVDKNLTRVFSEFMAARFSESNYREKRKSYFQVAKSIKRIEEGELFN